MSNRYCLSGLGNDELLGAIAGLVKRADEMLADLLAHLEELDQRRLYLELGFPSLFAYCTESLGMCESSAGRRILAARVCRKFPEAFAQVARGELSLSALCAMSPHLSSANAQQLVSLCSRRSRRDVEKLLAARFPRADVRESVRKLPKIEALSADRYGVHFTADQEFRDLLEQASALASHRNPTRDVAEVLTLGLKAFIREAEKERFGVGRKPQPPGGRTGNKAKRTRHIPAAVAREVYARDEGQCSFVSADGRRCGCRVFIELDHETPWAVGGASTTANLRLLCRAHNQARARAFFGVEHVVMARSLSAREAP